MVQLMTSQAVLVLCPHDNTIRQMMSRQHHPDLHHPGLRLRPPRHHRHWIQRPLPTQQPPPTHGTQQPNKASQKNGVGSLTC